MKIIIAEPFHGPAQAYTCAPEEDNGTPHRME
jgi:hypothetical protein